MTNDQIIVLLSKLEYSVKWVEYGFLDAEFLQEQGEHFDTSKDKDTAQYRYLAFTMYLDYHPSLTSDQLAHYMELAALDSDQGMAHAALGMLLQWTGLTAEQFDWLTGHPAFQEPFLQKMALRMRFLAEMGREPIDEERFARFLASGDEAVLRALLDKPDLEREQLERLRDSTKNRTLRNIADARLRAIDHR